jgi:hypothetical protein
MSVHDGVYGSRIRRLFASMKYCSFQKSSEMKTESILFWRAKVLRDSSLYSNVVPLLVWRDVIAASQEVSIMNRV